LIDFCFFNATFNNISAISWRPVLEVEEAGVPGETMGKQLVNFITCGGKSFPPLVCNIQSLARTHAVLVIGLYELLDSTT
jgi:acetaldehyde dehydrogenase (acetylating)